MTLNVHPDPQEKAGGYAFLELPGGTLRGEVSYFRVQGPSFLIEFDHTARDPNHVHSQWRDFEGDFGLDLLGEHLASVSH